MAQFETDYTALPGSPPSGSKWPLSRTFWIDLVIILVAVVVLSVGVSAYVLIRAIGAGLASPGDPAGLSSLSQAQINQLLGSGGLFVVLLLQNLILAIVPVVRVRLVRRESLAIIGFQSRGLLRLVLLGFGLGVLVLIMNSVLSAVFVLVFDIQQNQAAQYPLFAGDYAGQALFFLGAALLAPLGEEILFRGYAFNAFLQGWGRTRLGVAAAYFTSAMLFSAAHSLAATEGVIGLLVPTFVMGLMLAGAMHYTRSLVPCIIAHAINNGTALLALLTCVNNPGLQGCPVL